MIDHPRSFDFLLLPDFPLYAVVPATEALRIANQNAGLGLYDWRYVSVKGGAVRAGNGMSIEATSPVGAGPRPECLIVCGGNEPTQHLDKRLLAWLRRLAAHGVVLGALDTGAFALAAAGVVRDRQVTLHWEAIPVFRELLPERPGLGANLRHRPRYSDGGRRRRFARPHGRTYRPRTWTAARASSDQRLRAWPAAPGRDTAADRRRLRTRRADDPAPRTAADERAYRVSHRPLGDLREPAHLPPPVGAHLPQANRPLPAAAYLDIRLQVARDQLFYTANSISHVAEVTGFQSDAHFCRAFRKRFAASPSTMRRNFQGDQRSKYHPAGTRLIEEHREH